MLKFLVGFRKFSIMILYLIVMVIFRVYNLIDGQQFASNLQVAVVAYFGTNIGEHVLNLGKEWVNSKVKEVVDKNVS